VSNRSEFCIALAQDVGLDVNVIQAWAIEEEGWDVTEYSDLHNQDWLNIGYFNSGPGTIAFNKAFATPAGGAKASAAFLRGTWGDSSEGIRRILDAVGESPEAQCMKIGGSGWATNPDYGSQIYGVYKEIFVRGLELTLPPPPPPPDPYHYAWFDQTRIALPHGRNSERNVVENYDEQRLHPDENRASLALIHDNLTFLHTRAQNNLAKEGPGNHLEWRIPQLGERVAGEQVVPN
jgi:hypothetical protein